MPSTRAPRAAFLLVLSLALAGGARAAGFRSSFGFTAAVPQGWVALTREELARNPKLFDGAFGTLEGADPGFIQAAKGDIEAGRVEFFFAPVSGAFRTNVNVRTQPSGDPSTPEALKQVCEALPGELARAFGHPVTLHACRFATLPAGRALYLEFDGADKGVRNLQYNVARPGQPTLQLTATIGEGALAKERPVVEAFVKSVRFPK